MVAPRQWVLPNMSTSLNKHLKSLDFGVRVTHDISAAQKGLKSAHDIPSLRDVRYRNRLLRKRWPTEAFLRSFS